MPPILRCSAIQHIFASAKKHGKPSGILAPVEADARRYLEWGATFVAVGSDLASSVLQRRNWLMRLKNNHQDEEREHYDNESWFYWSWHHG
jgi:2-dehydro-3-deoxyglucarate aldolase